MQKNILIVGGTGRVARHTIEELQKREETGTIVSTSRGELKVPEQKGVIYKHTKKPYLDFYRGVMEDHSIDTIIHTPNLLNRDSAIKELIELSTDKIPIIFIGSAAVFTKIPDAKTRGYRIEMEQYIKDTNVNYGIVRPTMIFGHKKDMNIYKLYKIVKKLPFLVTPSGINTKHSPIYIKDLAKILTILTLDKDFKRYELNVAGPELLTFQEMVNILNGKKKLIIPINASLVKFVLKSARRMGLKAWHPEKIDRFRENKIADEAKFELREYGYEPTPFREAVEVYKDP